MPFLFWSFKEVKMVFCHKLIAFLCLKFSILYMLFLSVFCSNLKHDQIGLECKVYNRKLGLHVVVNMRKSVANIADLISFNLKHPDAGLTQSVDVGGSITIANGFIDIFSKRAADLLRQAKHFEMKFFIRKTFL